MRTGSNASLSPVAKLITNWTMDVTISNNNINIAHIYICIPGAQTKYSTLLPSLSLLSVFTASSKSNLAFSMKNITIVLISSMNNSYHR